jgi:DNA ligase-1
MSHASKTHDEKKSQKRENHQRPKERAKQRQPREREKIEKQTQTIERTKRQWKAMNAKLWDKHSDPSGWLMSEKLDGMRALWDGKHLHTRGGSIIDAPKWFTKNLPPFPVDGELFAGREGFQTVVSVARSHGVDKGWSEIKYAMFDAPDKTSPAVDRLEKIRSWTRENPSDHAYAIRQIKCKDKKQLDKFLEHITELGGEGVMLRAPQSKYEEGKRSRNLLKVRNFQDDEGEVVGHLAGEGKYADVTGSLQVKLKNGDIAVIGSGLSDADRKNPPPLGSTITFRFKGLTREGKLRQPRYLRVREDQF